MQKIIEGLFGVLFGGALMLSFSPTVDGIFKNGFILGVVFLIVGIFRLRAWKNA